MPTSTGTNGAAGLLVAPVSYQPLTDEEVYGLFVDVDKQSSVPLIVYDSPGTTHFTFSDPCTLASPSSRTSTLPGARTLVASASAGTPRASGKRQPRLGGASDSLLPRNYMARMFADILPKNYMADLLPKSYIADILPKGYMAGVLPKNYMTTVYADILPKNFLRAFTPTWISRHFGT